jgi:hypothetical protein
MREGHSTVLDLDHTTQQFLTLIIPASIRRIREKRKKDALWGIRKSP